MPVTTIARPKGDPGYSETLPCAFASVEPARGLVRAALAVWDMETLVDDAVLVVTELVANAARHTASDRIRVVVTRTAEDTALIAVMDKDKAEVVRRNPEELDTHGRGLLLVEALTAGRWGTIQLGCHGKLVWADVGGSAHPGAPGWELLDTADADCSGTQGDPKGAARRRSRPRILHQEPEAVTWARERAGLTKRALAEAVGISEQLMGEIESGWRNATPVNLARIAEALNCPLVVLERKRQWAGTR